MLSGIDYVPMRPRRQRQRSTQLSQSVFMSVFGEEERDDSDEDSILKRCFYEIIDKTISEMDHRFGNNDVILKAVESATDFLHEGFSYEDLKPLEDQMNLKLPSCNELMVARNYLNSKTNDNEKLNILKELLPVKDAFIKTYNCFEAIETFGSTTSTNESSFSALSRIDTIRRCSMDNKRLRNLSFLAFEKTRLSKISIDIIMRKFATRSRRIQLF